MTHTPGPWIMSGGRTRIGGEQFHTVGPDATGWIAAVIYSDRTTEMHRQSLADARLIAAAPDLVAALKALAACEHDPKYAPEVIRAGEAIKRAEPYSADAPLTE